MSKRAQYRRQAKAARKAGEAKTVQDVREIFGGEGQEPLTEELIKQLVSDGWDEKQVRDMAKMGGVYSRPRNTIILPGERWGNFE